MQVIYSHEHNNPVSPQEGVKILQRNIDKAYRLLYFNFALLVRVADQVKKESEIKASKFLPTEEDLRFSDKLASSPLVQALKRMRKVQEQLKLQLSEEETVMVKELLKKLAEQSEYKLYCLRESETEDERAILLLLHRLAAKNAAYLQFAEDNFPECMNELSKIHFAVEEVLKKLAPESTDSVFEFSNQKTEEDFAKELLIKTLENNARFTALIQPKLKNWDIDRIARLDMILMKMALCELLYFDQIPVKVSINEYIDVSKSFSTPKSKDFVNGILDSIMHDLRERNEIKKTGRGLVE